MGSVGGDDAGADEQVDEEVSAGGAGGNPVLADGAELGGDGECGEAECGVELAGGGVLCVAGEGSDGKAAGDGVAAVELAVPAVEGWGFVESGDGRAVVGSDDGNGYAGGRGDGGVECRGDGCAGDGGLLVVGGAV